VFGAGVLRIQAGAPVFDPDAAVCEAGHRMPPGFLTLLS
jgi:hypothetical protein